MQDRLWSFLGGDSGEFEVLGMKSIRGEALPQASHLDVVPGLASASSSRFCLRGTVSNERYVTRKEKSDLVARQEPIGRVAATLGVFIPIKKSGEWWALPQDERRAIFEQRSRHIALGQELLPAVARRLHHCRDLGTEEPFDFLTWFDFHPRDAGRFDDLLGALRDSEEWRYVEREAEVRVERRARPGGSSSDALF